MLLEVAVVFSIIAGMILGNTLEIKPKQINTDAIRSVVEPIPPHWSQQQHSDTMYQCLVMCGEGNVKKYSSLTASCECKGGK